MADNVLQNHNVTCTFFLQGRCRNVACRYMHTTDQQQVAIEETRPVCWYFLQGYCRNVACYFRHPDGMVPCVTSKPPEVMQGTAPKCWFYMHKKCKKPNCGYSHDMSDVQQPTPNKTQMEMSGWTQQGLALAKERKSLQSPQQDTKKQLCPLYMQGLCIQTNCHESHDFDPNILNQLLEKELEML